MADLQPHLLKKKEEKKQDWKYYVLNGVGGKTKNIYYFITSDLM